MKRYRNYSRAIVRYEDADGNRQRVYPGGTFLSPVTLVSRALVEIDSGVSESVVDDFDADVEEAGSDETGDGEDYDSSGVEEGPLEIDLDDLAAKAKKFGIKFDRRMSPQKVARKIALAMARNKELGLEI
jgi:hypothetical protein